MLANLDSSAWTIIITIICVVSFWIGWIADSILDEVGLGLTVNTVLVAIGAIGGLFFLDWLFTHYYVSPRYANGYAWFGASLGSGTMLLLLLCTIRAVIRRA